MSVEIVKGMAKKMGLDMTGRGRGAKSVYPFRTLEIGDGFEVALDPKKPNGDKVRVAAYLNGKKLNRKFSTSQDKLVVRVWRVS